MRFIENIYRDSSNKSRRALAIQWSSEGKQFLYFITDEIQFVLWSGLDMIT